MTVVSSAAELMRGLRRVSIPALYNEEHRAYSFKITSIYCAIAEVTLDGDYAEFGVYKGACARFIEAFLGQNRKLHLFDSFEGLPEDWIDGKWNAGAFKLPPDKIPKFNPARAIVYKGWFRDTVPGFARSLERPLAFIHMDADLYSSTIDVLFNLNNLIVPGTIIVFDEYVMKQKDDEHRALTEWAHKFNRSFDYLWRTNSVQVCVRITQ